MTRFDCHDGGMFFQVETLREAVLFASYHPGAQIVKRVYRADGGSDGHDVTALIRGFIRDADSDSKYLRTRQPRGGYY
jgi:hypothetical protein